MANKGAAAKSCDVSSFRHPRHGKIRQMQLVEPCLKLNRTTRSRLQF